MTESFEGENLADGTILKQGKNEMPRRFISPTVNRTEKILSLHKLATHIWRQAPLMAVRKWCEREEIDET